MVLYGSFNIFSPLANVTLEIEQEAGLPVQGLMDVGGAVYSTVT